ncbi:hypothetical protein BGX27_009565 [Mortierella sp. AM989]|nr:hypothetical protein BGX27_009565 [Mortierella sp. AM989]
MEFTFTATPSTITSSAGVIPRAPSEGIKFRPFSDVVSEPHSSIVTSAVEEASIIPTGTVDSQYDRVSLKREHGVGDTKQWRKRLITQIEDRIKDRRISIHNARRTGLQQQPNASHEIGFSTGDSTSISAVQLQTATEESASEVSIISEEEERRIIAEVWESFKNENFEALAHAFQGMTDKEIEDIEQEILQHNYYDPTYDMAVDMEMNDMEQTIEHYMRLQTSYASVPQEDTEMASAMSLSMTILSGNPCLRCQQGALVFEPVISPSQSGGAERDHFVHSGIGGGSSSSSSSSPSCSPPKDSPLSLVKVNNLKKPKLKSKDKEKDKDSAKLKSASMDKSSSKKLNLAINVDMEVDVDMNLNKDMNMAMDIDMDKVIDLTEEEHLPILGNSSCVSNTEMSADIDTTAVDSSVSTHQLAPSQSQTQSRSTSTLAVPPPPPPPPPPLPQSSTNFPTHPINREHINLRVPAPNVTPQWNIASTTTTQASESLTAIVPTTSLLHTLNKPHPHANEFHVNGMISSDTELCYVRLLVNLMRWIYPVWPSGLCIWDTRTGEIILQDDTALETASFMYMDDCYIAYGQCDGTVTVFDWSSRTSLEVVGSYQAHEGDVSLSCFTKLIHKVKF